MTPAYSLARIALLGIVFPLAALSVNAQKISFVGTHPNGEFTHKYFLTDAAITPSAAQETAQRLDSFLTTINNGAENSFVSSLQPGSMWIGLLRNGPRRTDFRWANSEPVTFINWGLPSEPNNAGGNENYVAINEHRPAGWNDLSGDRLHRAVIEVAVRDLRIAMPENVAKPRSIFLAIEGVGKPDANIEIKVFDINLEPLGTYSSTVDSDGKWERLLRVGMLGYIVRVRYADNPEIGDIIQVDSSSMPVPVPPAASSDEPYEVLRKADIILTTGGVAQSYVYGARYSHAALYVGGAPDGTPLLAEAVPQSEAGSLGQVRSAPIELSTVWQFGNPVDFYRPNTELNAAQRQSVAAWAKLQTDRGLSYWTMPDWDFNNNLTITVRLNDFSWIRRAWWVFDSTTGLPIPGLEGSFQQALNEGNQLKFSTNKYICSTLVWHAYFVNAGIDFSEANSAGNGTIITRLALTNPEAFLRELRPYFVFPDTIATSGKVMRLD